MDNRRFSVLAAPAACDLTPAIRQWAVYDDVHRSSSQLDAFQGLHGDGGGPVFKIDKGEAAGAAGAITGDPQGADLPEGREDGL